MSFFCLLTAVSLPAAADPANYPWVRFGSGQVIEGVEDGVLTADVLATSGPLAVNVVMTRNGSVFDLCVYRLLKPGTTDTEMLAGVRLPPLAAGDYVLEYSESNTWQEGATAPCEHRLTRPFTVIVQGHSVDVVEYYNAALDHYFMTADANERQVLDQGTIPGWEATEQTFRAFMPDAPPSPDLAPVCRYFGRPEVGNNSHFYSASASDCAYVADTWSDYWQLETTDAFKVITNASCGIDTIHVVRFYNNRSDANHRYVKVPQVTFGGPSIYQRMRDQGWIAEGEAWCVVP